MKAKCMILLLLAGGWVLWDNVLWDTTAKKYEWRPVSEYETLGECDTARLKQETYWDKIIGESEGKSKMGFIERFFTRPSINPERQFKCMPAGTVPR